MKIPYKLRVLGYWLKFHLTGKRRIKPTLTFNGSYPYQALQPGEKNRIVNGDMVIDQRPTWHKEAEL